MAVDFCYIISHGFATRMLLQTNLVGKLTDKGYSVAILSHDASDENLQTLAENPNVELVEWKSRNTIWDDDYLYKRMYFLEDLDNNIALREKFFNALFYSKSKHPWKRIRPLYYMLIFQLIKLFPGIRKRFLAKEGKHLASTEARNILDKIDPKIVVSTYPVSIMEAKMLHEARQKSIRTILHLLSWDNISCKGKFPALADNYIAWGDIMVEELKEYYNLPDSKIDKCGVPHFDAHVETRKAKQNTPSRPYLFFAMSSPRFAPREIDIVEWLARAIENNVFGENVDFIVRPHPQNVQAFTAKASWLSRLDKLSSNRVTVDYPELNKSNIRWSMKQNDMTHLSEMLTNCAICLNSGSTVSIDALMHNKPVILTSFDGNAKINYWNSARRLVDYPHLKKLVNEGGSDPVYSYEELEKMIKAYLKNPEHNLDRRRNALTRECHLDDGNSTERVASSLAKTLEEIN